MATYAGGKVVRGKDRTFQTKRQPLGLTLAASPATIAFGGSSEAVRHPRGTATPAARSGCSSNPYPYTQGFQQVGNPQVVGETGAFSFRPSASPRTRSTRCRSGQAEVVSPVVFVGVRVKVGTRSSRQAPHDVLRAHRPGDRRRARRRAERVRGEWRKSA